VRITSLPMLEPIEALNSPSISVTGFLGFTTDITNWQHLHADSCRLCRPSHSRDADRSAGTISKADARASLPAYWQYSHERIALCNVFFPTASGNKRADAELHERTAERRETGPQKPSESPDEIRVSMGHHGIALHFCRSIRSGPSRLGNNDGSSDSTASH
jgi:hypothetical protein